MTAARTGRKQPSIRTLWAIAKSPELHLTDEDLHAVVYRETGKESMKMLTQGEVNTVARVLQNMKDSVSRSVRDKRTAATSAPPRSAGRSTRCARRWAGMTTRGAFKALSSAWPMSTASNG